MSDEHTVTELRCEILDLEDEVTRLTADRRTQNECIADQHDTIRNQAERIAELEIERDNYRIATHGEKKEVERLNFKVDYYKEYRTKNYKLILRIAELEADLEYNVGALAKADTKIIELGANPLYNDRIALHQAYLDRGKRIAELEAVIKELEPYTDSIICYASTISEHDGNRVAKLFKAALQEVTDESD